MAKDFLRFCGRGITVESPQRIPTIQSCGVSMPIDGIAMGSWLDLLDLVLRCSRG